LENGSEVLFVEVARSQYLADQQIIATEALGGLGPHLGTYPETIVDALFQRVAGNKDEFVRCFAANALGALGPHLGTYLEIVINALIQRLEEDNSRDTRRSAINALKDLGPQLGPHIERVFKALIQGLAEDKDEEVRRDIVQALDALSVHRLEEDNAEWVRRSAADALRARGSYHGTHTESVVTPLWQRVIHRKDKNVVDDSTRMAFDLVIRYLLPQRLSTYATHPTQDSAMMLTREPLDFHLRTYHHDSLWALSLDGLRCYQPSSLFFPWSSPLAFKQGAQWLIEQIKRYT
jgi:HEAT repeat protein